MIKIVLAVFTALVMTSAAFAADLTDSGIRKTPRQMGQAKMPEGYEVPNSYVPASWTSGYEFGIGAEYAFPQTRQVGGYSYSQSTVYGLLSVRHEIYNGWRGQVSAGVGIPTQTGTITKTTDYVSCGSCFKVPQVLGLQTNTGTIDESINGIAMIDLYTPVLARVYGIELAAFGGAGFEFGGSVDGVAVQSSTLYSGATIPSKEIAREHLSLNIKPFVEGGIEANHGRYYGLVKYRHTFDDGQSFGAFESFRKESDSVVVGAGIRF